MDLSYKSTGTLIDESITAELKVLSNASPENIERMANLQNLINNRVDQESWYRINIHATRLRTELKLCWDAQEIVMKYKNKNVDDLSLEELQELSNAALYAQRTNAERCRLVREIDKALGESDRTYLEKTYA
jgi:uncharacterized transporter YbjL